MVGGRNHAAAGSKSENARVSLRRVRAGSLEAIDGDVRDAVCGAPVGVGLGRRGVAATRAGDDGGVQRGRLLIDGEAAGLAGRGTAEVGGTGNRRSPTAR